MKTYIQRKDSRYLETVDELDRADFGSYREFRSECLRLVSEYRVSDPCAEYYLSSRPCRDWVTA